MARFVSTILAVDDEFTSLEVLALLLEGEGFRVFTASDGEEAVAWLEKEQVDLVVTDFMMPKMTGLDLSARMLADPRWASIPVIVASAAFRLDQEVGPNIIAVLMKPLLFDVLLAKIRKALPGASGDR